MRSAAAWMRANSSRSYCSGQGHPAGEIAPGAVAGGQHVGRFLQTGLTGDRVALGQKSGQLRQIKL